MSSSFKEIREILTVACVQAQADHWSLARLTRRLYLLEKATRISKLLLEQELLEIALDMQIEIH